MSSVRSNLSYQLWELSAGAGLPSARLDAGTIYGRASERLPDSADASPSGNACLPRGCLWHIAYLERYVSLLLGMPTSIMSPRFAPEEKSPGRPTRSGLRRDRSTSVAASFQRNQYGNYDVIATEDIDRELNRMASRQLGQMVGENGSSPG